MVVDDVGFGSEVQLGPEGFAVGWRIRLAAGAPGVRGGGGGGTSGRGAGACTDVAPVTGASVPPGSPRSAGESLTTMVRPR